MQGIAGIVYPDIFQMTHLVGSMLSPIPKTEKTVVDNYTVKNIEFGIVGSSFATNEQKTILVGFDGHLTNTKELKKEYPFLDSSSIAHLTLSLYQYLGSNFVKKLQGEFIIVVHDAVKEELLLARDPIGKRTLYWYQDSNHFLFSTHLKSLLMTGVVPQTLAKDACAAYLYLGYLPQDLTPIKNVNKLLPGCTLTLKDRGGVEIQSYWSLSSHFYKPSLKGEEALLVFDEKLNLAVKKDCPPNKNPVGCFVSGGLGSAGIAYALTKNKEKTFAYSTFFENETREDLKAAEKIVTTLKIPHFTNKISVESFFNNLIPILWDLEEPIGDPNIVATYELTCLAENKTPLVFSGMGSDELLAAHNRYTVDEVSLSLKERWKQFFSPFVNHGLIPFFKIFYKPLAYKLIKSSKINPWQYQYLEHNTIFNKEELSQLAPNLVNLFDPEIFLNRFEVLSTFSSKISSYLYIDLKTRLVDAYIFQYSKLCNAKGIEWRTPYFDQPLVEFLISLHEPQNQKGLETSVFLKKLFENIYPKEVVNRPKVLRSHFLESWLKKKEVMEIFELLKGGYLVENGLISKECLNSALSEKNSWDDMFRSLFTLLVLEIWIRLFITESLSEFSKDISLRELLKR